MKGASGRGEKSSQLPPPEILLQNLGCSEDTGFRVTRLSSCHLTSGPHARVQSYGPIGDRAPPQPGQLAGHRRSLLERARYAVWPSPTLWPRASLFPATLLGGGDWEKEDGGPATQSPQPGTSRSQVRIRQQAGVTKRLPPQRIPHLHFPVAATPGTAPRGRATLAPQGEAGTLGRSRMRAPGDLAEGTAWNGTGGRRVGRGGGEGAMARRVESALLLLLVSAAAGTRSPGGRGHRRAPGSRPDLPSAA